MLGVHNVQTVFTGCTLCALFTVCAQLHHRFLHFPHFHPLCPHTVTWQPLHSTIVLVFSAYLTTCQCTPSCLMLQIFPAQLALCTHQSVFTLVRVQLPKSPSCSIHLKAVQTPAPETPPSKRFRGAALLDRIELDNTGVEEQLCSILFGSQAAE